MYNLVATGCDSNQLNEPLSNEVAEGTAAYTGLFGLGCQKVLPKSITNLPWVITIRITCQLVF